MYEVPTALEEFLHPCCVASAALVAAATTMVRPRGPIYCALRAPTPSGRTTVVIIKTVDWHLNSFGLDRLPVDPYSFPS